MFSKDDNDKVKKQNTYGKKNKISKITQPMKSIFAKKKKSSQKILKQNRKIKSNYLIIKKILQNHNITKKRYDIIVINNIMNANISHFLVCYKENLLFGFIDEYLRRFYHEKESKDRLPKISKYYHNYSLFFCKPTFRVSYANKILRENGEKQAKYFYNYNYERNEEEKKEKRKKSLNKKYEKIFNDDIIKDIDGISSFNEFNKSYSISMQDITFNSYKFSNESSFKSILNCFNNENNSNKKNNKNNKNIKNIVPAIKNFNKVIKVEKRDMTVVNSSNKKKKHISQLQLKKSDSLHNKNISHTYRPPHMYKKISSKIFSDLSTNNSIKKNTSFNNKLTFRQPSKNKIGKEIKENLKKKTGKNFSSNKSRNVNRKKLSLNLNFNTITQNENIYNTIINNKEIKNNLNLNELIDIFHTNTERNKNKDTILTFNSPTINNINININNNICINSNNIDNKISTNIQKSRNNHTKNTKSELIKTTKTHNFKIKTFKNDTNIYKTNYVPYSARKPKLFISPITNNTNMSPRIVNKKNKESSSKKIFSEGQIHKTTQIIKVQKAIFKKPKNN